MALEEAAKLNKLGASLLAAGNYDNAYRILCKAATTLQILLNEEEPEEGRAEETKISASVGSGLTAFVRGDFHVFSQDFQFEVSQSSGSSRATLNQKRFCIAIVLFNMALGRHAQAVQLGRDKFLEKTASLYTMCSDVLQQVEGPSDTAILMGLAGLNNTAAVCHEMGDKSRTNECLEKLAPLASYLSPDFLKDDAGILVNECMMNHVLTSFVATARCA